MGTALDAICEARYGPTDNWLTCTREPGHAGDHGQVERSFGAPSCPECHDPECSKWLDQRREVERRFGDLLDEYDGDTDAICRTLLHRLVTLEAAS